MILLNTFQQVLNMYFIFKPTFKHTIKFEIFCLNLSYLFLYYFIGTPGNPGPLSNNPEISFRYSVIFRCCGHTLSHFLQPIQSPAFP